MFENYKAKFFFHMIQISKYIIFDQKLLQLMLLLNILRNV